jgi:hypothetical protein
MAADLDIIADPNFTSDRGRLDDEESSRHARGVGKSAGEGGTGVLGGGREPATTPPPVGVLSRLAGADFGRNAQQELSCVLQRFTRLP